MSIKSRKLFAILVITAMMLALVPASVFAGGNGEPEVVLGATDVEVDETELTVGDEAKITMTFYASNGQPVDEADVDETTGKAIKFWIKTSRSGADVISANTVDTDDDEKLDLKGTLEEDSYTLRGGEGEPITVTSVKKGQVSFYITSSFVGTSTITFLTYPDGDTSEDAEEFAKFTLKYSSAKVKKDDVTFTAKFESDETEGGIYKKIKLEAVLESNGIPVKDETVTFQKSFDGGAWTTIATKKTNALGEADVATYETVPGDYEYRVKAAGVTKKCGDILKVSGAEAAAIKALTDDGQVAVDVEQKVKFKVTDALGNAMGKNVATVKFKLDKKPSGSSATITPSDKTTGKGEVTAKFEPDKVGEYTIKAEIDEKSFLEAFVTLDAKPFGTVTELKVSLDKDQVSVKSDYKGDVPTGSSIEIEVDLFDENGYKKPAEPDDVQLSSSDVSLVTVDGFEATATSKDKTGVVTITATHKDTGVSGSVELPVVGQPAMIKEDVSVGDLTANVDLQFVDVDGNKTWDKIGSKTTLTVVAPDGINVSARKDFDKGKGKASFKAVAEEYGTYNFTVIAANGLAKTFSISFGEPKDEAAAASVVMFINSTSYFQDGQPGAVDVAPFIEEGRTFVPIRFIGEAFGAELDWEPKEAATEKVFVSRDDIEVTITIGEYTIEVVKDGETETVVSDVAAFIKEGRTFLPLRAIGEILGAEFDWGPKDADTEWVSFNQ